LCIKKFEIFKTINKAIALLTKNYFKLYFLYEDIDVSSVHEERKKYLFNNEEKDHLNADSYLRIIRQTYDNKILLIIIDYIGPNSRIELFKFNSDLEYDSVYTRQFNYDSLCPHQIISDTIMPNCDVVAGLLEPLTDPETAALKVYPNPASQKITVEFPKFIVVKTGQSGIGSTTIYHHWKSTILEVYDLSGKKVFEKEVASAQKTLEMDISGWKRGMYYFRLIYNKQTIGEVKVVDW